jgi:UDP-glucose 4-epimerase
MKIFITGVAGFLGSHSEKRMLDLGHEVYGNDSMILGDKFNIPKNIKNEIFNIGPDDEETSINQLAEMIANETGYNEQPIHIKDRPQEVKVATCSNDKARKFLNYKTKTTLKESIRLTKDFIKKRGVKKFNYKLPIEINFKITPKNLVKKNNIIKY